MRRIPLSSARKGDILAQSVYDPRGRVLLKAGNRLTVYLISKIKEHQIHSLYIADSDDDVGSLKDVVSPLVRLEAVHSVRQIYDNFLTKTTADDIMEMKRHQFRDSPIISKLMQSAEKLSDEVFLNSNAMVEMVSIKSLDNYLYEHAVNVAVLSMLLGMDLHLKEEELGKLVLAALLMDIGSHFVDTDILNTPGPLTPEQMSEVQKHPATSHEYLTKKTQLPASVRHLILQHHERMDGSGYPSGTKGNDIHPLARILAIADTYDALTSDRPHRPGYSPNEALEMIMGSAGRQFDFTMVNLFAKRVVAYPVGTYVRLSNGDQGQVMDMNVDIPLRPVVKILKHAPGNTEKEINLAKNLNITVTEVIYQLD